MRNEIMRCFAVVFTVIMIVSGCSGREETKTAGGGGEEDTKPTYEFRLAETHAPDYPTTLADKHFAELVHERSDGRIKIDVFPSAALGEEAAAIEQVQLGAIDFVRTSAGPLAEFNKDYAVFSLPYLFDSDEHVWNFLLSEHGDQLLDSLESSKMLGLAYYSSGARSFYSSKPLAGLEDLQGQKIRIQQNAVNIDLMDALGASATPMAFGEVYSGLQTGVIDAAENNYPSYYSTGHYEVAPYFLLDGHQRIPEVLVISMTAWEKLSEEDQELIRTAAKDSIAFQREKWAEYEQLAEEEIRDAGVTVTEVADVSAWQKAVQPVLEKHGADYQDLLDAVEALRP
ncbi:tripartite ATP-independent transporter solute receptor, DctP family [Evansella caseinilytica]|uniref:Tripartite ATP-independent transporter solute receptor, DctP family n=1 Tax=Evansella caseinilytica TaxID=1503961 RepID=A0A1H3SY97_9BACI|nr:TRAP transporter substrate-binding protein [Evansella caseinilytica]SDZ42541.1 tripartite ATP-independent transporter solute receptor, DctP family [Evansella caseinilytica]